MAPPFLEEYHPLVDHTQITKVSLLTKQPIGVSSFSSYPGQRPVHPYLDFFAGSCRDLLDFTRIYGKSSYG